MKKLLVLLLVLPMLMGCGPRETFETVDDLADAPAMGQARRMVLTLPDSAAAPVVNSDGGRLFLCDGFDLTVQTLPGGDLERTVQTLCGYRLDQVTVLQTQHQGSKRYEWVWSAAGEGGDQVGRAVVISEGAYHYCVCAMADAVTAGVLDSQWTMIFDGVSLT